MNKYQLRDAIKDVLYYLHPSVPYSGTAVELLMFTAAAESDLGNYIKQIQGPALGIFQMEPATERDIWAHFLNRRLWRGKVKDLMFREVRLFNMSNLKYNLAYAIAMARIHYFRVSEKLPDVKFKSDGLPTQSGIDELARYWKKYYNTRLGKGTVAEAANKYVLKVAM